MNHADATNDPSKEIVDFNLGYLVLAQRLLRENRATAMLMLGMTDHAADLILPLAINQLVALANSNFLLCSFRLDELPLAKMLQDVKAPRLSQAHISIVLASQAPPRAMALAA